MLCYIGACFGIYALTMLIRAAYLYTGQFENFIRSAYGYNHLLTIAAAVALFYAFKNREPGRGDPEQIKAAETEKEKHTGFATHLSGFICRIASCSFGVYLLHEQVNIRYEWPFWLWADKCDSVFSLLWHWAAAILIVMAIGIVTDYARSLLFKGAGRLFAGGRLDRALKKVDDTVNGLTE